MMFAAKYKRMRCSKSAMIAVSCLTLICCGSNPQRYPPFAQATRDIAQTKAQSSQVKIAAISVYEAEDYLKAAAEKVKKNDLAAADQHLYLANKKNEVALELIQLHKLQRELEEKKKTREQMISEARGKQSTEFIQLTQQAQEAQLKADELADQLRYYQAEEPSRGTLLVINDLLFTSGGSLLEPGSQTKLEPLVQYLQTHTSKEIIIEGHTDSTGGTEENLALSVTRSDVVKQFLISRGIESQRIETRGFGEEVPIASNTTEEGKRLNRRVEIVIKSRNQKIRKPSSE